MRLKRLILFLFILLACFFIFAAYKFYFTKSIANRLRPAFKEWYIHNSEKYSSSKSTDKIKIVESPLMKIDKIFRSMEGPSCSVETYLCDSWPEKIQNLLNPKLLWLTGYSVEIYNEKDEKISEEFMCHNNLNISVKDILPWKINTQGTDKRLFTLTEGQTNLKLPRECGIPVLSNQKLRIDFQVLNHNQKNINLNIKQRVKILFKEASTGENIVPLYQQAVFITKQISGPKGEYNTEPDPDSLNIFTNEKQQVCCGNTFGANMESYNHFNDKYNRIYTGHWEITNGEEKNLTNVTPMLNLLKDTKAYFISVHVHPFCNWLSLINGENNEIIYKAMAVNKVDKIGLDKIDFYSNPYGILLKKSHPYYLQSTYQKTDSARHTAMATMFLYLEEN
jgi:hypothetical protein